MKLAGFRSQICVATIVLLAICSGCKESPEAGFNAFLAASYSGDTDLMWERFDRTAKERMIELQAMGVTGKKSPQEYLGSKFAAILVEKVEVLERNENKATLRIVSEEGTTESVTMVLEGDKWRVAPFLAGKEDVSHRPSLSSENPTASEGAR